ncbi:hypothetical protein ACEPAF_8757 [Sanghuangporus sanghuang]
MLNSGDTSASQSKKQEKAKFNQREMPKTKQSRSGAQVLVLQKARDDLATVSSSRKENIPVKNTRSTSLKIEQLTVDLQRAEGRLNETQKLAIQQAVDFDHLNKEFQKLETANESMRHHLVQIQVALTKSEDQLSKAWANTSASQNQVRYLRFVKEGEVVSRIQLGEEMRRTIGFTTGGDGTTNKSQNFDSFHLNFSIPKNASSEASSLSETVRHVHFGNLRMEANHRAETQMNGDIQFIQNFIDLYKKSPLGQRNDVSTLDTSNAPLSIETAALKYHGSHGDHAEDQKAKHRLLAAWKETVSLRGLGAKHFFSLPEDRREAFICGGREKMIEELGSESAWRALTPEEQAEKNLALTGDLADELAGEALLSLSEEERR